MEKSVGGVAAIRDTLGYKGTPAWILTPEWPDGVGTPWTEAVAFDEFKRIYAYVDAIFVRPCVDQWTCNTLYPPILV